MKTMDVSVVIPSYNQTRFLGEAIRSALGQTRPPLEIIVVDDGSTDGCQELVAGFGDVVRYRWQPNRGLASARNTGIRAARGQAVGLLDADDRWKPDFLSAAAALAAREPDAVAYYARARAIDEFGNPLPQLLGGPPIEPDQLWHRLLRANFLIPSTVVLARKAVVAADLFDESVPGVEDWDLWLRLSSRARMVGSNHCGTEYRIHAASLSKNTARMRDSARKVVEKHFGPDDGAPQHWTAEKRRAHGGLYRYRVLTGILDEEDAATSRDTLRRALRTDSSLAADLDFFYDLALGCQPVGFRGTANHLDLEANAARLESLLVGLVDDPGLGAAVREARRTAYKALGLVAYNTGEYRRCRQYFLATLRHGPAAWSDRLVLGDLAKSLIRQLLGSRPATHVHQSRH